MSEIINITGKPYKQAAPLISLMKAKTFKEYNDQFRDLRYHGSYWANSESEEYNKEFCHASSLRAIKYINRDNAQVLVKAGLRIAHKMPDGQIQLWTNATLRDFYSHEYYPAPHYFTSGDIGRKDAPIIKMWLKHPDRRRYDSYEEYIKSESHIGG